MKTKILKITSLLLALLMAFSFTACQIANDDSNDTTKSDENTESIAEEIKANPNTEIKISVLNGTTALGMAQMINNAKNDNDDMNYVIEVFAAADAITGPIVSGDCHIAALPTNVAAKLYKDVLTGLTRLTGLKGDANLVNPVNPVKKQDAAGEISERHRHRYELAYDSEACERLEAAGLKVSGLSPDGKLVEIVELPSHPYFIAGQFHPEFKSRPTAPHPLFLGLVTAALKGKTK